MVVACSGSYSNRNLHPKPRSRLCRCSYFRPFSFALSCFLPLLLLLIFSSSKVILKQIRSKQQLDHQTLYSSTNFFIKLYSRQSCRQRLSQTTCKLRMHSTDSRAATSYFWLWQTYSPTVQQPSNNRIPALPSFLEVAASKQRWCQLCALFLYPHFTAPSSSLI